MGDQDDYERPRGGRSDDSIAGMKITIREVIILVTAVVSIAITGYGIVLGISAKLDIQTAKQDGRMDSIQVQIQGIKDAQATNTQTLHMELEDLKKRLDNHEARTCGKGGCW